MMLKGGVNGMTNETVRFTLRMNKEFKEKLEETSKKMRISLNSLVVQILWDWVEHSEDSLDKK